MHFNSITSIILSFALLSAALPRYPPTNYEQDLDDDFEMYAPSAPTQTPLHTTALMAGAAMQTPLHTTVLMAAAALPTIPASRHMNAELRWRNSGEMKLDSNEIRVWRFILRFTYQTFIVGYGTDASKDLRPTFTQRYPLSYVVVDHSTHLQALQREVNESQSLRGIMEGKVSTPEEVLKKSLKKEYLDGLLMKRCPEGGGAGRTCSIGLGTAWES